MKKTLLKIAVLVCLVMALGSVRAEAYTLTKAGEYQDKITPLSMTKSIADKDINIESKASLWNVYYDYNDVKYSLTSSSGSVTYYNGCIIPIHVTAKGDLYFRFTNCTVPSGGVYLRLATDSGFTDNIAEKYYYSTTTSDIVFSVPKSGDYYLFFGSRYSDYTPVVADLYFRTFFYSGASKTLKSGTWQACASNTTNDERYYKMVITAGSNVTIMADQSMSVDILNSKKTEKYPGVSLSDAKSHKATIYLPKGTYYIKTKYSMSSPFKLKYTQYKVSGSTYQMSSGKTKTISPGISDSFMYIKYTAKVNGYVTLTAKSGGAYVTLMNSARDASRSDKVTLYDSSTINNKHVFGVKKGVTYYFKLTGAYSPIKLYLKETAVTDNSGAKKSEAKSMTRGTSYKGTITAGSSTVDYYKFKLSTKKSIKVCLKGSATGKIKLTLYNTKGEAVKTSTFSGNGFDGYIYSLSAVPAGTYYAKVQRGDTKSSGYYSIKWIYGD